jgi:hypothetical protein
VVYFDAGPLKLDGSGNDRGLLDSSHILHALARGHGHPEPFGAQPAVRAGPRIGSCAPTEADKKMTGLIADRWDCGSGQLYSEVAVGGVDGGVSEGEEGVGSKRGGSARLRME